MALKILIPMAGRGSRFETAGYTFPKPFIDVKGQAMIALVADNLKPLNREDYEFIFIAQEEHCEKYDLHNVLKQAIGDKFQIVSINGVTEGAACTALMARDLIDNDDELLIANSDQYLDPEAVRLMHEGLIQQESDGVILTFQSTHPKWSYVRTDEKDHVTEVAEKKVISDKATAGIYWWKKGSDFVRSADSMISKDIRTQNEFYIAPTFNELIIEGKHIANYMILNEAMHGLGDPESLTMYLNNIN